MAGSGGNAFPTTTRHPGLTVRQYAVIQYVAAAISGAALREDMGSGERQGVLDRVVSDSVILADRTIDAVGESPTDWTGALVADLTLACSHLKAEIHADSAGPGVRYPKPEILLVNIEKTLAAVRADQAAKPTT